MSHPQRLALTGIVLLTTVLSGSVAAAPTETEKRAAESAVLKAVKNPEGVRFGTFTPAGAKGACLTVFKKGWETRGTHEAFLTRNDTGWDVLYVADIASGHQGCIDEMSKR